MNEFQGCSSGFALPGALCRTILRRRWLASLWAAVSFAAVVCGLWLGPASIARATLDASFPPAPGSVGESHGLLDITTSFLETSYTFNNASSGTFAVDAPFDSAGFVSSVIDDITGSIDYTTDPISDFKISLNLDPATGAALSGTFDLLGTAPAYGASSGTLLTGSILNFYSPNASQAAAAIDGQEFQFVFNVTGGDLASHFGDIAVDLHGVDAGSFNGSFGAGTSFDDSDFNAFTDTYSAPVVPEPSSMVLLAIGAAALISRLKISFGSRVRLGSSP